MKKIIKPRSRPLSLMDILRNTGLSSNLLFVLDAGDAVSYSGDRFWRDLSGNGNHFEFSSSTAASADEPIFSGMVGSRSESNFFTGRTSSRRSYFIPNPAVTFDDGWSQNNGVVSFVSIVNFGGQGLNFICNGDDGAAGNVDDGITLVGTAAGNVSFGYDTDNVAGTGQDTNTIANAMLRDRNNFVGFSFDEAATDLFMVTRQGFPLSDTALTASTNTNAANQLILFGAPGVGLSSLQKAFIAVAWSRALTLVELTAFREALRIRFPSMS